ncbi:hypothetical protein B0H13DRAFT_2066038 [Mycena leptocephala]|nr:hypothetical protein B0H13DRAFT_2066038 [Mycena leptocephala]
MRLFFVRLRALAPPFLDGLACPLLPTALHIHIYGQIPGGALVLGDPLPALVRSRGITPHPGSRRRVLVHLCGGSADYL